jgi:hypothetical protein
VLSSRQCGIGGVFCAHRRESAIEATRKNFLTGRGEPHVSDASMQHCARKTKPTFVRHKFEESAAYQARG